MLGTLLDRPASLRKPILLRYAPDLDNLPAALVAFYLRSSDHRLMPSLQCFRTQDQVSNWNSEFWVLLSGYGLTIIRLKFSIPIAALLRSILGVQKKTHILLHDDTEASKTMPRMLTTPARLDQ